MTYRVLLILVWLIHSCTKSLKRIETYHTNGQIESVYFLDKDSLRQGPFIRYFDNGRIDYKADIKNNKALDTAYHYHNTAKNTIAIKKYYAEDSTIHSIGFHSNKKIHYLGSRDKKNRQIGDWIFFDAEGDTSAIFQHKIIKGKSYVNQARILDTIMFDRELNSYFQVDTDKRTVMLTDSIQVMVRSVVSSTLQLPNKTSDFYVTLPQKGYSFSSDFSNADPVDLTSKVQRIQYSMKYEDKQNSISISYPENLHKIVRFYYHPSVSGKDTIRGMFTEFKILERDIPNMKLFKNQDSLVYESKTSYFDIPIEVVE